MISAILDAVHRWGETLDLAELLHQVRNRGYTLDFSIERATLRCAETRRSYAACDARIVDSIATDTGTDPGDDVTLYLIEMADGTRGFIMISDSFHADPAKAAIVDQLLSR